MRAPGNWQFAEFGRIARVRRFLIPAMAAVVVLGGGALIYHGHDSPTHTARLGPTAAELAAAEWARRAERLDTALAGIDGTFSVALLDERTGLRYAYRGAAKYDTASIVKADILACMLLRAQDAGRAPTARELALATPMIQLSDNDATTALFQRIGGKAAVTTCNKRLGLTATAVDAHWGLTRTTAGDQITLLTAFDAADGPLDTDSRETVRELMSGVDPEQDWGVPVIARAGETATVKNGWDTRTADNGRWVVNTIGRLTSDEVDVSVAVLSRGNASREAGIALVEKVATATRAYLKY